MMPSSRTGLRLAISAGTACLAIAPGPASAASKTAAGATIENTATASYDDPDGGPRASVPSNTVRIQVDELIDVVVDSTDPAPIATRNGASKQITAYRVTNTGNGTERYRLTASGTLTGDDFDPAGLVVFLDSNGNGRYDEGTDVAHDPGGGDLSLTPDQSATVFILADIPASAGDGQTARVQLTAAAATGTGAPGTVLPGRGVDGGDAVIGANGGDDGGVGQYRVSAAAVSLTKSQAVADPFGGTRTVPGSTITYTLIATVSGSGSVSGLTIKDPMPPGSTYVASSLTVGGGARTDAADGDGAQFDGGAVAATFGTVPAGESRTVTFQVKVD